MKLKLIISLRMRKSTKKTLIQTIYCVLSAFSTKRRSSLSHATMSVHVLAAQRGSLKQREIALFVGMRSLRWNLLKTLELL